MSEYYTELFNESNIHKLDDNGNLFHLNTVSRTWEEISGVFRFDYSWTKITEDQLYESMLDFYIATSKYLVDFEKIVEKEIKTETKMGNVFRFFLLCEYVVAVDENQNQYMCQPDLMIPTTEKVLINTSWKELEKCEVIKKIQEEGTVDLSKLELYQDLNGDVIALSSGDGCIYRQSMTTGEIFPSDSRILKNMHTWKSIDYDYVRSWNIDYEKNISHSLIQERIGLDSFLYNCNKKYRKTHKTDIGDLFYYRNPFGKVYAVNVRGEEFEVHENEVKEVEVGTVDREWERVTCEYVKNDVILYKQRNYENRYKNRITLYDLNLYYNLKNEICGVSEDGKYYKMDSVTGEFKPYEDVNKNEGKRGAEIIDVVKKQAETIYFNELNTYINKNEERLIKEGREGFGDTINFYGRLLDTDIEVYAMDSNCYEYICTLDSITPIARGTINSSFVEYQDKFVMTILKFEKNAVKDRLKKTKKLKG